MNKPSSLYHYTSFDAIVHILDYNQECLAKRGMMNFRFGNPLKTNDRREICFFENHFFTDSELSKEVRALYEEIKRNSPNPFFLSLIHHKGTKWHPKEEIPMWYMYGDYSKGIRIAFDYALLEDYCIKESYTFDKCSYYLENEMCQKASELRKTFTKDNRVKWEAQLKEIYANMLYYKTKDWDYENEYRIITWGNQPDRIQKNEDSGKIYYQVPIPLDCVREITIGPLADLMVVERSIMLIKEKLQGILSDIAHFEVNCSKLQIR